MYPKWILAETGGDVRSAARFFERKCLIYKRRHVGGDIGGDGGDVMSNSIEIKGLEAETELAETWSFALAKRNLSLAATPRCALGVPLRSRAFG
jgi:hypothetical protein